MTMIINHQMGCDGDEYDDDHQGVEYAGEISFLIIKLQV